MSGKEVLVRVRWWPIGPLAISASIKSTLPIASRMPSCTGTPVVISSGDKKLAAFEVLRIPMGFYQFWLRLTGK
eukprot:1380232-Amorphochlora_amoeboformis.AAC.2